MERCRGGVSRYGALAITFFPALLRMVASKKPTVRLVKKKSYGTRGKKKAY